MYIFFFQFEKQVEQENVTDKKSKKEKKKKEKKEKKPKTQG
jgi:hypothetical protein